MEKKTYVSPRVEMVKMEVSDMMACSVNAGGDVNIGYGGNASEHDIIEAYSNKNGGWDIWLVLYEIEGMLYPFLGKGGILFC